MRSIDLEGDTNFTLQKSVGREGSKAWACLLSLIFLSPRRVSPFIAWGDFHARSSFARSTIPEEKWGTTRSLAFNKNQVSANETSALWPLCWLYKHRKRKNVQRFLAGKIDL